MRLSKTKSFASLAVWLGLGGCANLPVSEHPVTPKPSLSYYRFWAPVQSKIPDQNVNKSASKIVAVNYPATQSSTSLILNDFSWPLSSVTITSPFGPRKKRMHEGLDLRAPIGTPVYAAMDGLVVYAHSKIRGYGRMLIIRHADDISTVYAHNSRLLVRKGQYVSKGQLIAYSGKSGRSSGPHLHFEIRKGRVPLNPVQVLQASSLPTPSRVTASTPVIKTKKKMRFRTAVHKAHSKG